jgi:hypothetical protein
MNEQEASKRLEAARLHTDTVQALEPFRYGGHGWVIPMGDGKKANCGGPTVCRECALEKAVFQTRDRVAVVETVKLEPGDRILLMAPPQMPPSMVEHMMNSLRGKFPDIDITVVQGFTGIQVSQQKPENNFNG